MGLQPVSECEQRERVSSIAGEVIDRFQQCAAKGNGRLEVLAPPVYNSGLSIQPSELQPVRVHSPQLYRRIQLDYSRGDMASSVNRGGAAQGWIID